MIPQARIGAAVPSARTRSASLTLVRTPRAARVVARLLVIALGVTVVGLVVIPWQQSIDGSGRVIAFSPVEREQQIQAPVDGRVVTWHVQEGSRVKAGDPIVDLADVDPAALDRIRTERDAQLARLEAAKARLSSLDGRIDGLSSARGQAIDGASSRTRMAEQRVVAAEQALRAAEQAEETARLNIDRQSALFEQGLASQRTVELARLDEVKARTEVDRARAALAGARDEASALRADQLRVASDTAASLEDARASRASAAAEVAAATAELARIEGRLSRQSAQKVTAPVAGTVLRVFARSEGGEVVKAGAPLAVLVPDTEDRAVELWVDGNDAPLIDVHRPVRLQFEGWPAVQFTGWPSVAVGTFGGRVALVDATDDGQGRFRVLIVPDEEDEPWPDARYLRQGVRAQGWVLLQQVRLGFELWRQFNGFPPALMPSGADGKDKGGKDVAKG